MVVADAEHGADEFGGRGTPGVGCSESCSARDTRRSVYAGAGDFMDYWNGDSPLDLVEHEIGHALDWPHSTTLASNSGLELYDSALDVMSDSSAPRMIISTKRHGQGTLAINLYAARWFDDEHLQILDRSRRVNTKVQLLATDIDLSIMGTRFVVIADGVNSFLTVELIAARGDNAHLKFDAVAIHRITVASTSGVDRQQTVVEKDMQEGEKWAANGLSIEVLSIESDDGEIRAEIKIRSVERNSVIG
jgi:acid stress-induced BolA-like protein IbaG/YrbA